MSTCPQVLSHAFGRSLTRRTLQLSNSFRVSTMKDSKTIKYNLLIDNHA